MKKDRHIAEKGFVQKFINVSDFAESQGELYLLCTNRYFTSKASLFFSLVTQKYKFDLVYSYFIPLGPNPV